MKLLNLLIILILVAYPHPGSASVGVPPDGVLVRLAAPSGIMASRGMVEITDPALRSAFSSVSQFSPRLVKTGDEMIRPLLLLKTGRGLAVDNAVAMLSATPGVLHVEPNYNLVADSASEPSDFYFQANYWPYYPFNDPDDNPSHIHLEWETCTRTDSVIWDPPANNYAEDIFQGGDGWHLKMTQTNLAWLVEDGDSTVVVAIIDSGVDWQHPDLAPNIWQNSGEDVGGPAGTILSSNSSDPFAPWVFDSLDLDGVNDDATLVDLLWVDDLVGWRFHGGDSTHLQWEGGATLEGHDPNHGHCVPDSVTYGDGRYGYQNPHGTQMASIIGAAHNGFGCAGVVPKVSMMAINAGKAIESGDTLDIGGPNERPLHYIGVAEMVEGLHYAVEKGADIINISLSYSVLDYGESQNLLEAIEDAIAEGVIICSSAGNTSGSNPRWPAGIPGVLCSAAVRADSIMASQSSFADYVSFSAPSGEIDKGLYPQFKGDEYMAAVKWSEPEPFWPQFLPPHKVVGVDTTHTGPIHTYKQLRGDTSGCAAQLSGAFALLKAHYPNHSRQELIDEMIRGAVDVDSYQLPLHQGKLGHGLINPYRSLTEWGGPRDSEVIAGNVTWSGEVWISGDYETPAGCTLTIDPGTTVHIAGFDNETPEDDSIKIIADQIYAIGSPSDSILFRSYGPSAEPYAWSLATREGSESVVQMRYCDFENLWSFKATGSATAADSSFISNSSFLDPAHGAVQALELTDIHLTACEFGPRWTLMPRDSVRIEWCKIEHDPTWNEFVPAVLIDGSAGGRFFIENSIIRDSRNAIRFDCTGADTLILNNVLIEHAHEAGVQSRGETGINIRSGKVRADHLTLSGYTLGVSTEDDSKFSAEYSSFTDCYQAALNNPGDFMMFFGYYVQPGNHPLNSGGYNIFEDNERQNIVNLHSTGTISARHNWWGSASGPPPKSNRGRVDTLYHLLVAPNLPPPPNFAEMVDEAGPAFAVGRNFPNPFNPVTKFTFTIPSGGGKLRATVYDIRGRRVRNLADSYLGSGEHSIEFDGRDDGGEALSSGIYLCRFNFRDREEIIKATLVK